MDFVRPQATQRRPAGVRSKSSGPPDVQPIDIDTSDREHHGRPQGYGYLGLEPIWVDAREHVKSCEVVLRDVSRSRQ